MSRKREMADASLQSVRREDSDSDQAIRRCVSISPAPPQLTFKIANTATERMCAYRVVHDAYLAGGHIEKQPHGVYRTKYHQLAETEVLVALWNNEVIATASLIPNTSLGLPLEAGVGRTFLAERSAIEVGCLAIESSFRGQKPVLFGLQRLILRRALMRSAEFVAIAVTPKWMDFYRAVFGFQALPVRAASYGELAGAPAVVGFLYLDTWKETLRQLYRGAAPHQDMYAFIFGTELDDGTIANTYDFPVRLLLCD